MATLEELKEENARLEAEAQAEVTTEDSPQEDEVVTEEDADETETEAETENAESSEEAEGEAELEDWMQGDDQASQSSETFTGSDIAAAKKKLRAKLERQHDAETEELKARIAELEAGGQAPQELTRPKREDFYDEDDPDEAYAEALVDWKLSKSSADTESKLAARERERQQQEQLRAIESGVDAHCERAAKLAESSGITSEAYTSAELNVRRVADSVFPGAGDNIVDGLIASLGEGSEKVFYNLGVNSGRRAEFEKLLREDQSGIKAALFLGKLNGDLSKPQKRTTKAPAPAPAMTGDESRNDVERKLKKRYAEADRNNNRQAAFNIRREARKAGVDTKNW